MRLVVSIDSRLSDAAGLVFVDLAREESYTIPVETGRRRQRNGFRGGCFVGKNLALCTSSAVMQITVNWPIGSRPEAEVADVIRRPEWAFGDRANADLHDVFYDEVSEQLLVVNSYMDCIDSLDMRGRLIDRKYLWDISDDIRALALDRADGVADLCHANKIFTIEQEAFVTLANLNGTRKGAVLSLVSGKLFAGGLAFPHDGVWSSDGLWLSETDRQRIILLKDVQSAQELRLQLKCHRCSAIEMHVNGERRSPLLGKLWVRGLHVGNDFIVAGCSQFDDLTDCGDEREPSHIAVLERQSCRLVQRFYLPENDLLPKPVIYSVLLYREQP